MRTTPLAALASLPRLDRVSLAALAAALLATGAAGCGKAGQTTTEYLCQPACPTGFSCTSDGCVAEGSAPDLGAGGADLAVPCGGGCGGAAPYCKDNLCVPCITDDQCPAGTQCKPAGASTACRPGCADDARCNAGGPGGLLCCGGQCVDPASDPGNCGACGTTCMASHAGAACAGGKCAAGTCDTPWADCNADPADGCEANLSADAKNCGACGTTCSLPHAIAGCDGATPCYVRSCEFGFDDCNGVPIDGCEASVVNDIRNCGGCGNSCTFPPHAKATCLNSSCQLASCDTGYADCDGDPRNGCEVQTGNDVKNCGACGAACQQGLVCKNSGCTCPQCNFPNASSQCVNNVCVLDKCVDGWGDCNKDPKDGCEQALTFDAKNCGACGNVCPQNTPYCTDGVCGDINNTVLIVYASPYEADVKKMISGTGAFKMVDEFDASRGTPTLMQLQPYGAVLAYSDNGFQNPAQLGDVLADYFDGGGQVVVAVFANCSVPLTGRFGNVQNGYLMIQPAQQEQPNDSLGVIDEPNSPLMRDVMSFKASSAYKGVGGVVNGGTVVAHWQGGKPLVIRGTAQGRNVVTLNFYPPSTGARQDFVNGDVDKLLRNALLYR